MEPADIKYLKDQVDKEADLTLKHIRLLAYEITPEEKEGNINRTLTLIMSASKIIRLDMNFIRFVKKVLKDRNFTFTKKQAFLVLGCYIDFRDDTMGLFKKKDLTQTTIVHKAKAYTDLWSRYAEMEYGP
jgi:hypothetical protein